MYKEKHPFMGFCLSRQFLEKLFIQVYQKGYLLTESTKVMFFKSNNILAEEGKQIQRVPRKGFG